MVADIHTKHFTCADKWLHASSICNVVIPSHFEERIKQHSIDYAEDEANALGSDLADRTKSSKSDAVAAVDGNRNPYIYTHP